MKVVRVFFFLPTKWAEEESSLSIGCVILFNPSFMWCCLSLALSLLYLSLALCTPEPSLFCPEKKRNTSVPLKWSRRPIDDREESGREGLSFHFLPFFPPPASPFTLPSLFLKGHSLAGDLSVGVWSARCGSGMPKIIISAGERERWRVRETWVTRMASLHTGAWIRS